jgi:hypothetical protein
MQYRFIKSFTLFALIIFGLNSMQGQTIELINPSFESEYDTLPFLYDIDGWDRCESYAKLTSTESWAIPEDPPFPEPVDGKYYLHLLALNDTANSNSYFQSVSQSLSRPLVPRQTYSMSANLTTQWGRLFNGELGFHPGLVEFYLGMDSCGREQLIYVGETVDTLWREHYFEFTPNEAYDHLKIRLNVPHSNIGSIAYIDHLSDIQMPTSSRTYIKDVKVIHYPGRLAIENVSSDNCTYYLYSSTGILIKQGRIESNSTVDIVDNQSGNLQSGVLLIQQGNYAQSQAVIFSY